MSLSQPLLDLPLPLDIQLDAEVFAGETRESGALSPSRFHGVAADASVDCVPSKSSAARASRPRCESGADASETPSPRVLFPLSPRLQAHPFPDSPAANLENQEKIRRLLTPLGVGARSKVRRSSGQHIANLVAMGPISQKTKMKTIQRNSNAEPASLLKYIYVALLSVLMGATDGLSLGSIIFPHDDAHPNNEYRSLGMSLGLFTAFVSNFASCLTSQIPHAVGGAVMPAIPLMAAYFEGFGTENCATVMIAIPFMTSCIGLMTIASGYFQIQELVKACPFIVFGGFIATTGIQLLQFSLSMVYGKFKTVTSTGPDGLSVLAEPAFWKFAGPPALVASLVFLVPRMLPGRGLTFLMPCSLFFLTIAFYLALFLQGGSIADARQSGWLFDVQTPNGTDFLKIWTMYDFGAVKWELIFSSRFLLATFQVYILTLLTSVSNIYGTAEVTNWPVDIDKEIRAAGMQTLCCGLTGCFPGNIVMSFSVTAHNLGVRSKEFSWMLAAMSFCFFLFGSYIIAFLPRMVPACVLMWLGLVLASYWIWDGVGKIYGAEHGVVVVMICVGIFVDMTHMIALGVMLTLGITMKRMMTVEVIREGYTLQDRRSDILRTENDMDILEENGVNVRALRIGRGYLSFISASALVSHVRHLSRMVTSGEVAPFYILMIEFQEVALVDTTVLKALNELLALGRAGGFHLLLVGCTAEVEAAIVCFDIKAEVLASYHGQMHMDQILQQGRQVLSYAKQLAAASDEECQSLLLIGCRMSSSQAAISSMNLALEFCETYLLERAASQLDDALGRVREISISNQSEIAMAAGLQDGHALLPLFVDIHSLLAGNYREYDVSLLEELSHIFTVQEFKHGETIYVAHTPHVEGITAVPPLVWLLSGEVEHIWVGDEDFDKEFGTHFKRIAETCGVKRYQRLEKAALAADSFQCVGFFQTSVCFFAAMEHPGMLMSVLPSRCVLLQHQHYQKFRRERPKAAELLFVYLTRKRLAESARLAPRPMLTF
eukprot:TRINITY_DN11924_c0_g4_i3.p1 TRINITY_DN11924_c0_g4~~TRINITY_DN11924_c0_g4_i3.p1  ORF type:complete len:1002 (+),score=156.41 TRINITY_DN11924_c0_g4_i3:136-3141(+)